MAGKRKGLDWAKLHIDILDHPKLKELSESDQLCWLKLIAIAQEHNRDGELPAVWWIAKRLGKQQPATYGMLARLISAGLVEGDPKPKPNPDDPLRMHDWADWQGVGSATKRAGSVSNPRAKHAKSADSATQNTSTDAGLGSHNKKEKEKENRGPSLSPNQTEARKSRKKERPLHCPSAFEGQFWPVYPRKVGKAAAEKAWAALNPSAEQVAELVAALRAQIDAGLGAREPEFIPHPATWINGKRWLDEPPSKTEKNPETWKVAL